MKARAFFLGLLLMGFSPSAYAGDGFISGTRARELIRQDGAVMVDVRTPEEYAQKHVPGALLFPVQTLASDLYHLGDFDRPLVLYCRSGRRSAEALKVLGAAGFTQLHNMGPLDNWDKN